MHHRTRRRLSIFDVLVLVGACALGLAPLRYTVGIGLFENLSGATPLETWLLAIPLYSAPPTMSLTLAVLALSFRDPRGSLRTLTRRPGFVACLVVMVAALHPIVYFAVQARVAPGGSPSLIPIYYVNLTANMRASTGPMIIAAWVPMALGGRWRPVPTWVDRTGCVLGFWWIALFLLTDGYQIVKMMLL